MLGLGLERLECLLNINLTSSEKLPSVIVGQDRQRQRGGAFGGGKDRLLLLLLNMVMIKIQGVFLTGPPRNLLSVGQ